MSFINGIKKRPVVIALMALTILGFYLSVHFKSILSPPHVNQEYGVDSVGLALSQHSEGLPVSQEASKVKPQAINSGNEKDVIWIGDAAQNDERLAWLAARGWYDVSNNNKDDYKTYSKEALEQLANNGDLKALTLLVKGTGGSERKNLETKAAVYGSTFALVGLIRATLPLSAEVLSSEQKKARILEGAAYAKVAEMRGDLWPTYEDHLKEIEDGTYKEKFTDEDRQAIDAIANDIYADLESQRMALGLGKFDNSYPPLIRAYYKSIGVLPE